MSVLEDKDFLLNTMFDIITSDDKMQAIVLNYAQQEILKAFWKHRRIIVLKSRQQWGTTFGSIFCLFLILFVDNKQVIITAHNQWVQKEAFKKVKKAFDQLLNRAWTTREVTFKGKQYTIQFKAPKDPKNSLEIWGDGQVLYVPKDIECNQTAMSLSNNSSINVVLESSWYTMSHWHNTELAKNQKAEEVYMSGKASLNNGTMIVESTAWWTTGTGKVFYDLRKGAVSGKNGLYPVFIPWYKEERYQSDYNGMVFPTHIEKKRKFLKEYDNITQNRKLQWYYETSIDQKGKMSQEYPSYPEEAFLASGDSVFDAIRIKKLREEGLHYEEDEVFNAKSAEFDDVSEWLRIYRDPTKYCYISIDPAWGSRKWDYTAIIVRDIERRLLACYYGKAWPDKTYNILKRLNLLWYTGLVIPEINAHNGWVVFKLIKDWIWKMDIKSDMYIRPRNDEDRKSWIAGKEWWETNSKTRKDIVEEFERQFENWMIDEIDERILNEMWYFHESATLKSRDWTPKKIASDWEHDDWIIGECIVNYVIERES